MTIRLEQLFYGRGECGYAILGTSPGGMQLAARVKQLCDSVGTPGVAYNGESFLLSVPEDDHVLMVCGRRGAPDSMGRETLFFHALAAAKKDFTAANANALTLFDQGAFSGKMPDGNIDAIRIDCKPGRDDSTSRPPSEHAQLPLLPCFVRASRPCPDAVRHLVGDRANELSWATFVFQPLAGFDVQVLPPRAAAPHSANECDADGNLVHAAARQRDDSPADRPQRKDGVPSCPTGGRAVNASPSLKQSAMLKLSLFANLALLALCAALFASRRPVSSPVAGPAPTIVTNTVCVTNTVERTNVIDRLPEKPVSVLDGTKDKEPKESTRTFLANLQIPDCPSMEDLTQAVPAFGNADNVAIRVKLQAVFDFIDNLQNQKSLHNKESK